MTVLFKQLAQTELSTTAAQIYATPTAATALLKNVLLANTSGVDVTVTLNSVPTGATPGVGNTILPGVNVPAHGLFDWGSELVLPAGTELFAVASAAGVCLTASGAEIS